MDDDDIFKKCQQKENEINNKFQLIENEPLLCTNRSESCYLVQELSNEIQTMYCILMQCYNKAYNIVSKTEEKISQTENKLKVRCKFSKEKMDKIDANITRAFDDFFATLKELMRLASSFINFVKKMYSNDCHNEMQIESEKIYEFAWNYIKIGLHRAFVFTAQPPLLVVKNDTATNRSRENSSAISDLNMNPNRDVPRCASKFNLDIKCYCLKFLISHTSLINVPLVIDNIKLYNEEDIKNNLNGEHRSILEERGQIRYEVENFTEIIGVKCSTARVGDIRVAHVVRTQRVNAVTTQRRDHANVGNTRYCLTVTIKSQDKLNLNVNGTIFFIDFDFQLTTLPFCVLSNQSQRPTALPQTFWFRTFPYDIFIYRLNELFKSVTGCGDLAERYQKHIAFRLFGCQSDYNLCHITFDMFYNNFMQDYPNTELTFWKWLYAITELISKSEFKLHWNQGIILLISRHVLESFLMIQTQPTAAIRFADTMESSLTFSVYFPGRMNHVVHICLKPFLDRELSLSQAINLMCRQYRYLYQIQNIIQLQDNEFVVKPIQQFIVYDNNMRIEGNTSYIMPVLDLPLLDDNRFHNFLMVESNL